MDLRRLSDLVGECVMDECRHEWQPYLGLQRCSKCECRSGTALPAVGNGALYAEAISAAWQVVEKMAADGWLPSLEYERGEWVCHMGHVAYDAGYAVNKSASLAICLAACDAFGVEVAR